MSKTIVGAILGIAIATAAFFLLTGSRTKAGPNGGDIAPLADGEAYGELLANSDTGELMVHTWDADLETAKPIKAEPLTVGSGDTSVELMPHPLPSDPAGYCSRFYGQADWVRGGGVKQGWMHQAGHDQHRQAFKWQGCWQGGRSQGAMWTEMGEHRQHGGMGHGHPGDGAGSQPGPVHD